MFIFRKMAFLVILILGLFVLSIQVTDSISSPVDLPTFKIIRNVNRLTLHFDQTMLIRFYSIIVQYKLVGDWNNFINETFQIDLNSSSYVIANLKSGTVYVVCAQKLIDHVSHSLDNNCQVINTLSTVSSDETSEPSLLNKSNEPYAIVLIVVGLLVSFAGGYTVNKYTDIKKCRIKPKPAPRPSFTLGLRRLTNLIRVKRSLASYINHSEVNTPIKRVVHSKRADDRKHFRRHSLPNYHPENSATLSGHFRKSDYEKLIFSELDRVIYESIASGSYASIKNVSTYLHRLRRMESLYESPISQDLIESDEEDEVEKGGRFKRSPNFIRAGSLKTKNDSTVLHM